MPERLTSALGVAGAARRARSRLSARATAHGAPAQRRLGHAALVGFAVLVLRDAAPRVFGWANGAVNALLGFSKQGAAFVFGPLVDSQKFGFVFAFQVLPTSCSSRR